MLKPIGPNMLMLIGVWLDPDTKVMCMIFSSGLIQIAVNSVVPVQCSKVKSASVGGSNTWTISRVPLALSGGSLRDFMSAFTDRIIAGV
jgi:hypothetical protein